jgi:hypothetical protein
LFSVALASLFVLPWSLSPTLFWTLSLVFLTSLPMSAAMFWAVLPTSAAAFYATSLL